jgi:polar amino acid transport system substrate-binding protein
MLIRINFWTRAGRREPQVDFVTYFSAGSQCAQRTGAGIDPNNACGKKGLEAGAIDKPVINGAIN